MTNDSEDYDIINQKIFNNYVRRLAVVAIDANCNIIFCNAAMQFLLPVPYKEAIGHDIDEFELDPGLKRILKTGMDESFCVSFNNVLDKMRDLEKATDSAVHDFLYPPTAESTPVMYIFRHPLMENGEVVGAYASYEFAWKQEPVGDLHIGNYYTRVEAYTSKPISPVPSYFSKIIRRLNKGSLFPDTIDSSFSNIIGSSSKMRSIKEALQYIAPTDSTVLITGENGTGKELIARAINANSKRADKPFITINCSAVPESLIETELFGYEPGSFTDGLKGGKAGKFEAANGGTIFLDEMGDMPMFMQPKILRVLQEREVTRVGGTQPIPLDIRIIAATNFDLKKMVNEGTFREDLYYRINVIRIDLPPLRERTEDIPSLVCHYIDVLNDVLNKNVTDISPAALSMLCNCPWPGNVRELCNTLEAAMTFCQTDTLSLSDFKYCSDIEDEVDKYLNEPPAPVKPDETKSAQPDITESGDANLRLYMETAEQERILSCLRENHGDKTKTAEQLNISRATLYRKLKRFGIV